MGGQGAGVNCVLATPSFCTTFLGGIYKGDGTLCTEPGICPNPVCGNGVLDPGEVCDDGFLDACGSCNTDCSDAGGGSVCGDEVLCLETEACDEGILNSDDPDATCRTDCTAAGCGDGIVDTGEACDEGASNSDDPGATCRTDCSAAGCGDGILDLGEVCDDGNNDNCDGCRSDCSAIETGCGDGFVCLVEVCDDGNNDDCDGCRADCSAVESGCGDGFVCGAEECDDGNTDPGDGCDESCVIEDCAQAAVLTESSYDCNESLSRIGNNILRFIFGADLTTVPAPGEVEIRVLLDDGLFGVDISDQFVFSIEASNVLKIVEPGQVFVDEAWYAVMNTGGWCDAANFQVDYPVVYGDANGDRTTGFADLSAINANQSGLEETPDDSRFDINTLGGVSFNDLSAANSVNGSQALLTNKPTGHTCPK